MSIIENDNTILMKVVMSEGDPCRASLSTMLSSSIEMSRVITARSLNNTIPGIYATSMDIQNHTTSIHHHTINVSL